MKVLWYCAVVSCSCSTFWEPMDRPHCSPGVMSNCQQAKALQWTGDRRWRPRWTEAKALRRTGGNVWHQSAMVVQYTEGRLGNGGVSPRMDCEATSMDWRSRVPLWCSNLSGWCEGVQGRLWRLQLKTTTQVTKTWRVVKTHQDRRLGPGSA